MGLQIGQNVLSQRSSFRLDLFSGETPLSTFYPDTLSTSPFK